ncbi:MAG: hypothetical protein MZV63_59100 [Marinilabiliales bacterium]|nr:hypothetical protein [Marinilabiliales bacterium]
MCDYGNTYDRHYYAECYAYLCSRRTVLQRRYYQPLSRLLRLTALPVHRSPAIDNTGTTLYTFTPDAGQCATTATLTIVITPNVTPTFAAVGPFCHGATITALPTTSLNGITGTWSPAIDNTITTLYTFTPDAGQCATTATLTIVITPNVTPTFAAVGPFCNGATITALPTTSLNGITGDLEPGYRQYRSPLSTRSPLMQVSVRLQATLTIVITPNVTPTFAAVGPFCHGATITALPTTSLNGITGTWSPAIDNTDHHSLHVHP